MRRFLTAAAALVFAVGACSSPDPKAPEVASIKESKATATPAGPQRPQLRLDTSDEESNRLFTAYDDCLVAHGVKVNPVDQPGPAGPGRRLDQSGEPKSAYVACAAKLPQQPPELDPAINPQYAEQWNDDVRCLRKHGMKVHVTEPGSYTYDDNTSPEVPASLEHECLLEAFGAGSN
jgi:hypothetical protein